MKIIILFLTSIFLFSSGCSSTENTASDNNIQILNATYNNWSRSPVGGANVPEVGTDLSVTVKNWSSGFTAEYIIYNNRKSLSATISDSTDESTTLFGKIIRASSKLPETSKSVSESDRLVYTNQNGEEQYIEIKSWKSQKSDIN